MYDKYLSQILHLLEEGFKFKVQNPDLEPQIVEVIEIHYDPDGSIEAIGVIAGEGNTAFYGEMYTDDTYNTVELLENED